MRYKNWDVLIFPSQSKIPQQEFKTSCHVVQDFGRGQLDIIEQKTLTSKSETHLIQSNPSLLAIVTCFIPSLKSGEHFRLSIHSWDKPEYSRHYRRLKRLEDTSCFQARLFIDGKESSTKRFDENGPWPTIIDTTVDEHGQFKALEFPIFHRELLSQNFWNPVDDLGRLRLVISEGFTRNGATLSFERIQNVISFSFQHAPLNLLESSSIAWPNSSMWQQLCHGEGLQYSKACCSNYAEDTCENDGCSPGPFSVNSPWLDNEEMMLIAKVSRNERQSGNHSHLGTVTTPLKIWHDKTLDLVTPDFFRRDSYSRATQSNQIEILSSDNNFERIFESLLAAPSLNTHQDNVDLISEDDASVPNQVIQSNFEDEPSSFSSLDSEMFDISKTEAIEFPDQLTGLELNTAPQSVSLSSDETKSFPAIDESSLQRSLSVTPIASSPRNDLDKQDHNQCLENISQIDG